MDKLRDLLYRLQDHPLYRQWENIPRQKKMLSFAIAGLAIALIILTSQLWHSTPGLVELKPDEIQAAKQEARLADRQVLENLSPAALKDELTRRQEIVDEAKKTGDPERIREAEESWERANEIALDRKK